MPGPPTANWAGPHPAKRTPPVASSSGCGYLRVATVRGSLGSRGPRGVGRCRTVEAFRVDRAQVGDLALLQLEPLQLAAGGLTPPLGALAEHELDPDLEPERDDPLDHRLLGVLVAVTDHLDVVRSH